MTTTVVLPEVTLVDVPLEARDVLGGGDTPSVEPARVSLGRTEALPLATIAPDDEDLARELRRQPDWDFWAVSFTCSFWPDDDPVVETRLGVQVRLADPTDGGQPEVTLLEPDRLTNPVQRTRSFSFNPKVAAGIVEAGVEGGQSTVVTVDNAYVVATGRGEAVAQWWFKRRPGVELEGMHDLHMVFRTPAGRAATAELRLASSIQRRFAGLIRYRAHLPESLRLIPVPAPPA